jgi:hypothetical protein
MKDSEDRVNNITLNTLFDQLKELKEIILEKKEGDLKLKDNQEIEDKFEQYPDTVGLHTFRLNMWILEEFLQLVDKKDWKIQTSISKAMLLFIDNYKNENEDTQDEMNKNN